MQRKAEELARAEAEAEAAAAAEAAEAEEAAARAKEAEAAQQAELLMMKYGGDGGGGGDDEGGAAQGYRQQSAASEVDETVDQLLAKHAHILRETRSAGQQNEETEVKLQPAPPMKTTEKKKKKKKKPKHLWAEHFDSSTGLNYYHNRVTKVTTWVKPDEFPGPLIDS